MEQHARARMARAMRLVRAKPGMVGVSRTAICVALTLLTAACGVVLPAADDLEDYEPTKKDGPVTTKGTTLPAPNGPAGDGGAGEAGTPGTPGAPSVPDAGGDAAPPAPPRGYVVFVTSQVYASDDIGGLSGADKICASLAAARTALAGKKWAAWLSTSATSASSRLGSTPGPWVRPDGIRVADGRGHINDKLLPFFVPISVDEQLSLHGDDHVWTGTRSGGTASADTCNGWNGTMGRGLYGKIAFDKPTWTEDDDVECDGGWTGTPPGTGSNPPRNRLYCFEID